MTKEQSLRDEYLEWIRNKKIDGAVCKETEDGIRFETDFAIAEVNFYEFEIMVAELRITNRKNDETEFFLHFELRDIEYAKELFGEMTETLEELRLHRKVQVLLSCTSALTTTLMAEKLNAAAELLSVDYTFDAVPFPELYDRAPDYDMILLAPQIAYESKKIQKILKHKIVVDIPPRLFATYDAAAILEVVRNEFDNRTREAKKESKKKNAKVSFKTAKIVTAVVLLHSRNKFHVICRAYVNGEVVDETEAIRGKKEISVLVRDALDTIIYKNKENKFDAIGLTVPGEVDDGRLYIVHISPKFDLKGYLEDRYKLPVIMKNNAHSGIIGFHSRHSHYQNCVLLTQSLGARFGGCGIIANGKLIDGAHNAAGEIKYFLRRFYGLSIRETYGITSEEMLMTVELMVRAIIAMVDPEIIIIRNGMITDMDALREALLKTIPERNMPKLRRIEDEDALEYMLLGIMILCIHFLEESSIKQP